MENNKMLSVLFDFDGTLFDTSEGIINGFEEVEKDMALEHIPHEKKRLLIGPPLYEVFQSNYGLSEVDAKKAVNIFRDYYALIGKNECKPYEGIKEVLDRLNYENVRVFVATSKPTVFAKDIIESFEMTQSFEGVVGSNSNILNGIKRDIIEYILGYYECNHSNTIMVGDKAQDIIGAKEAGVLSMGVTYGFGTVGEIINNNPDMIVNSVREIVSVLQGKQLL